jgi:hypothetical protein
VPYKSLVYPKIDGYSSRLVRVLYAVHVTNTKTEARDFSRTSMKKSFVKLNGLETGCHHYHHQVAGKEIS